MQQAPSQRAQPYLKVLVTGDRNWSDYGLILSAFQRLRRQHGDRVMIIHGKAAGADALCGRAAAECGFAVHGYPAMWARYGRAAGPKRNQEMIDENPDIGLCLVIHDNLPASRGTRDCWARAQHAQIPTRFIKHRRQAIEQSDL